MKQEAQFPQEKTPTIKFKENAELYKQFEGFAFPTTVRDGVIARHIKSGRETREYYARPTEPYEMKIDFLKKNAVADRKSVLTILGANWPLLYADLSESDRSIVAVDENLKQVEFLNDFLTDPKKFESGFKDNDIDFVSRADVPYYPTDVEALKLGYKTMLLKPGAQKQNQEIGKRRRNGQNAKTLRSRLAGMATAGNLNVVVADIRHAVRDLDLGGVDFVDLSNVPELIGAEETQGIINSLSPQTLVYMAFLKVGTSPEVVNDFFSKLHGVRLVDSFMDSGAIGAKMVLVEKE